MVVPQTDGQRIIFPLTATSGTYNSLFFDPSLVDGRIQMSDIQPYFDEIYTNTNNLAPVRKQVRYVLWALFTFLVLLAFGVFLEVSGFSRSEEPGDGEEKKGWAGLSIILASSIFYVICIVCIVTSARKGMPKLYKSILDVTNRHQYRFQNVGLRWVVPQNCRWLELWMDYRMGGYNPPMNMGPNAMPQGGMQGGMPQGGMPPMYPNYNGVMPNNMAGPNNMPNFMMPPNQMPGYPDQSAQRQSNMPFDPSTGRYNSYMIPIPNYSNQQLNPGYNPNLNTNI